VKATVTTEDNSIHFAEEICGRDPKLDQAFRARSAGR
jgi:hypothetical protein